ncbi:MAG: glycoside hydrolase family 3 N-terminal domain-containing protein, partial [Candidatus Wildermuthbacteria bacterium]|nr:glycoside hydrolase family 3 N-terminal domain-containing protein [Candidatus Wildermuthbacteria bacterium]
MINNPPDNLPIEPKTPGETPVKESLKRDEIETMEKDVVKLREGEAQKEKEKIATIKIEKTPRPIIPINPVAPVALKKEPPLDTLIPPKTPQAKPAFPKKALIKVILAISCVLIVGALLFIGLNRPKKITSPVLPGQATTTPSVVNEPEIIIPQPLIPVAQTKVIKAQTAEEILKALTEAASIEIQEGEIARIVIEDKNRIVPIREIAQAFQIEMPEGIFQKLEENYTLAIFNQKEGKRGILVAKHNDKSGLIELLKNWEAKILKDGVAVFGEKIPAIARSFKTAALQGVPFRYLSLSKTDMGVCYLVFDDYLVLTNSFESMKKAIQGLTLGKKVGQLFFVGFDGKTVTPQLESFFEKYKPGGVLLLSKNIESKEQLKSLTTQLQNLSRRETGQTLFIAVDQEGGLISRVGFLSEKTPQKEIKSLEQANQVGLIRGRELKELGINVNLSPVLDWATAGDFLFDRTFQQPTTTAGDMAKSLIQGQKTAGILTAVKHFPGYSGITFNPEDKLAALEKIPEISQFKKAGEANPEFVMTSNVIYRE